MNLNVIREQRKILHADLMWRKNYIETTSASQAQSERDRITAKIDRMAPGLRVIYLRRRLDLLKSRLE